MPSDEVQKNHLSWSQIACYHKCPRQYYFKYILGLPQWPVYDLLSGRAVHAGLEEHNRELARNRPGLRIRQMLERGITEMEETPGIEDLDIPLSMAKDRFQDDATPPLVEYLVRTEIQDLNNERARTEEDVEKELVWEFEGKTFLGYADLVLPSRVIDYKLLSRAKSTHQIQRDGQLTLYQQVLGKEVGFVQLIRGADRANYVPMIQTPGVTKGVLDSIRSTIKSIEICKETGHWPMCQGTEWVCDQVRCQYWQRCYGELSVDTAE